MDPPSSERGIATERGRLATIVCAVALGLGIGMPAPANTGTARGGPALAAPAVSGKSGGPGTRGAPRRGSPSAPDRNFVLASVSSGLLEVEASRLALDRSRSAPVRAFAQRRVEDHGKSNDELQALAKDAGVGEVPARMLQRHTAQLDRLRALNGAEFDDAYVAGIVALDTEAAALADAAARAVANADVRAYAKRTAAGRRDQLRQAQALARTIGVPLERLEEANAPVDVDLDSPSALREKGDGVPSNGAAAKKTERGKAPPAGR